MTKAVELNTKLNLIKDFISDTVQERGYPPTMREISAKFEIKSTSSVSYYLKKLEDAGELKINSRLSRGIELKDKKGSPGLRNVPLVGRVTAGQPRLAFDDYEDIYSLPEELFDLRGDIFMLTVEGSSMIDAGINDGDKIIVKKQSHADDGQIVVALMDDECATVKRLKNKGGRVCLHPENRAMDDIYPENLIILGVVVGLIRTQIS